MNTLLQPKPARRRRTVRKSVVRASIHIGLTVEDIAPDNAISAVAARSLASRRP